MTSGAAVSVVAVLPAHVLVASVITGEVATVDVTLPAHTLLSDRLGISAALPAHTLSAHALAGELAGLDAILPIHTLVARATAGKIIRTNATLPGHTLSAHVAAGAVASLDLALRTHSLAASTLSGAVARSALVLPAHELVAHAFGPYTAVATLRLPTHTLTASARSAVAAVYNAWVMNLRNKALSEYENFNFVSFAVVDGRIYAAGPSGIFELGTQDTDAGTAIAARILLGQHNFGTSYSKRVPRIYTGYESSGDLEFRTITGADGRRGYLLPWNYTSALQQRRVPVGRGPRSVYWQFEVLNRNGADFQLDNLIVHPELTKRRYQG